MITLVRGLSIIIEMIAPRVTTWRDIGDPSTAVPDFSTEQCGPVGLVPWALLGRNLPSPTKRNFSSLTAVT